MSPTYSICREHGYITGEHFSCPICGKNTEVYSRITGYYRPIQNWNDGKAQEYKDRKEYDIAASLAKFNGKSAVEVEEKKEEVKPLLADGLYLFSTTTCPNCRMAKNFLHQASFEFEEVIANENPELTRALNINQAPTLVEVKDGQVQLIENVSNIRRYIESIVLVKA